MSQKQAVLLGAQRRKQEEQQRNLEELAEALQQQGRKTEVVEELGEGGEGLSYLLREAEKQRAGKLIILKDIDEKELERLYHEAEVLSMLNHPRIVKYLGLTELPDLGAVLLESEFFDAKEGKKCLREVLAEEKALPERRVAKIMDSLLEIFEYLHDPKQHANRAVIHRDVKLGNMFVDKKDNAYLADFGVAKLGGTETTVTVHLRGTHGNAAPEQYRGDAFPQSDLFGLGVTALELLLGERPDYFLKGYLPNEDYKIPEEAGISRGMTNVLELLVKRDYHARPKSATKVRQMLRKKGLLESKIEVEDEKVDEKETVALEDTISTNEKGDKFSVLTAGVYGFIGSGFIDAVSPLLGVDINYQSQIVAILATSYMFANGVANAAANIGYWKIIEKVSQWRGKKNLEQTVIEAEAKVVAEERIPVESEDAKIISPKPEPELLDKEVIVVRSDMLHVACERRNRAIAESFLREKGLEPLPATFIHELPAYPTSSEERIYGYKRIEIVNISDALGFNRPGYGKSKTSEHRRELTALNSAAFRELLQFCSVKNVDFYSLKSVAENLHKYSTEGRTGFDENEFKHNLRRLKERNLDDYEKKALEAMDFERFKRQKTHLFTDAEAERKYQALFLTLYGELDQIGVYRENSQEGSGSYFNFSEGARFGTDSDFSKTATGSIFGIVSGFVGAIGGGTLVHYLMPEAGDGLPIIMGGLGGLFGGSHLSDKLLDTLYVAYHRELFQGSIIRHYSPEEKEERLLRFAQPLVEGGLK